MYTRTHVSIFNITLLKQLICTFLSQPYWVDISTDSSFQLQSKAQLIDFRLREAGLSRLQVATELSRLLGDCT